jgi:FkbM family methyltransferase
VVRTNKNFPFWNCVYSVWAYVFALPYFRKINTLLFHLSLRGLGVLNYQTKYLSGELDWLKKYLSIFKEPVIFDVGANVGNYSNDILKLFPHSKIYAFEPHPQNFLKLEKLVGESAFVFKNAVGDKFEQIKLYDYKERDGSSHASLYQGVIEDIHFKESTSHTVDVVMLDQFCLENNVHSIDLLKIDTEGNELKCLMGAMQLLGDGKIKAIQFEFNEMNIISRSTFKDFWDLLDGFDFYRLLPGGKLLPIRKYSPGFCKIYAYQNIVALKRP